jgi:uncharacterized phage protein gp47/JayE
MYEDRTQEVITEEMLDGFGANVRTDVGSLAFNACVKTGSELEDVYTDLETQEENALPDTMDLVHLIRFAAERGTEYKYATYAVVKAVFLQEMSIGDRLMCEDYIYDITEAVEGETNTYLMECEEDGTGPNTILGDLEPVDYIDGYQGGEITEVSVPGTDDEDEEVFRARVIGSYTSLAFGGNKADFRQYIDSLSSIGGCKVKRRDSNSEYINIYIIDSSFGAASNTLVNTVQELIDPIGSQGEGDGKAAVNQKVIVQSAGTVTINAAASLTLDDGYDIESIAPQVPDKIEAYLLSLRKEWEANEQTEDVVRLARVEAAILTIEGVLDVTNMTLNGSAANVNVAWQNIPVLGTVNVQEA